MTNKTRAQRAADALKAAMRPDYEGNLGLNEAYRMGLEDMVNWIDLGFEPPFTGVRDGNVHVTGPKDDPRPRKVL
jgi:hypothetical protein